MRKLRIEPKKKKYATKRALVYIAELVFRVEEIGWGAIKTKEG
jgi:hypothetical protein